MTDPERPSERLLAPGGVILGGCFGTSVSVGVAMLTFGLNLTHPRTAFFVILTLLAIAALTKATQLFNDRKRDDRHRTLYSLLLGTAIGIGWGALLGGICAGMQFG